MVCDDEPLNKIDKANEQMPSKWLIGIKVKIVSLVTKKNIVFVLCCYYDKLFLRKNDSYYF